MQLLKFMKEEDQEECAQLASVSHIDTATWHIRRLALALHLALLVAFPQWLSEENQKAYLADMENDTPKQNAENWSATFEKFLMHGCKQNATFTMHVDMMRHCRHVVAIALSDSIGGVEGHSLLMAVVKDSLPFSFMNNASLYASVCGLLLYPYKKAGFYTTNA